MIRPSIKTSPVVASFSGGKDSTALCLWLLYESDVPRESLYFVFADTKWEHNHTYAAVLRMAERHPVQVVRSGKSVLDIYSETKAPLFYTRACTQYLKVEPINTWIRNTFPKEKAIQAIGIRHEESHSNNNRIVDEWVYSRSGWMWYPVRLFTLQDVWDIHKKYDFPVNKLYTMGFERVGCYPCIFSDKKSIRLINELNPDVIHKIDSVYEEGKPFFVPKVVRHEKKESIQDIVQWSQTTARSAVKTPFYEKRRRIRRIKASKKDSDWSLNTEDLLSSLKTMLGYEHEFPVIDLFTFFVDCNPNTAKKFWDQLHFYYTHDYTYFVHYAKLLAYTPFDLIMEQDDITLRSFLDVCDSCRI